MRACVRGERRGGGALGFGLLSGSLDDEALRSWSGTLNLPTVSVVHCVDEQCEFSL